MNEPAASVVIVGGGITGLATAYYLQQAAREDGLALRCTLVEADHTLGGKVRTERVDGFVIEQGPDSFLARKPEARQLAGALGLGADLIGINPDAQPASIMHRGRLEPLPRNIVLAAPVSFQAYYETGLLSFLGKLRVGLDLILPSSRATADESLGHFIARRLGREVAANMAGPLLSGIYAADMNDLSLLATFPQLRDLEQQHGSLLRGLAYVKRRSAATSASGSAFLTVKNGLGTLIEKLVSALTDISIVSGVKVSRVERSAAGYDVSFTNDRREQATAVVLAVPAFEASTLLSNLAPQAATELRGIPYASTAAVALVYPAEATTQPLQRTGFLVPRGQRQTITGCTWVSVKWPHAAPSEQLLVRCFVGRSGAEEILASDDEEIVRRVDTELQQIMGLTLPPSLSRVYRWPQGMPQYRVGHLDRLQRIEAKLKHEPGLVLAGAGYRGIGIPDCIRQGTEAAERVLAHLRNSSASA